MNAILSSIKEKSQNLLKTIQSYKKIKYLSTFLTFYLQPIIKAIESKGSSLKETLNEIENSFIAIEKEFKILKKTEFFDKFGSYSSKKNYIAISHIIEEIKHIYQKTLKIMVNQDAKKIVFEASDMELIDKLLAEINSKGFKNFKFFLKINHEFTYILLGLDYIENEEEKNEDEDVFELNSKEFKGKCKKFFKKMNLRKEFSSQENLDNIVNSFDDNDKITIKNIDNYFKRFFPFDHCEIKLSLFYKNDKINNSTIRIFKDHYIIDKSDAIPLQHPYRMRFGREVIKDANEIDYFFKKNMEISRKQFEIKFTRKGTSIQCFSHLNFTNFLLTNNQKLLLETFSIITIGEKHMFYIRETERNPIENSMIPFKGGPFIVFKGISTDSEYYNKKILIKLEGSKVDEQKENFYFVKIIKREFIIGKDLSFEDEDVQKEHAVIGYDDNLMRWFIRGGFDFDQNQKKFWNYPTRLAVFKFDDTDKGICKPRELEVGNMINVEDYAFRIDKIINY